MDDLPEVIKNKWGKGPRASVSAESFGVYNPKEEFKPKLIQKSRETKDKILLRLNMAFMF
jgi:hypothetical protein